MKAIVLSALCCMTLGACAPSTPRASAQATPAAQAAPSAEAAISACKSALALRQSVNPVQVLPISSAAIPAGREVFLSLAGKQWLCMTDAYGNVSRLEQRG